MSRMVMHVKQAMVVVLLLAAAAMAERERLVADSQQMSWQGEQETEAHQVTHASR